SEVDGTGLRVRRGAELRGSARENLRAGRQLRVGLQTDHDFPLLGHGAHTPAGALRCQSVARWNASATCSIRASLNLLPTTCRPTGRGASAPAPKPPGTLIPGRPARLTDSV